MELINIKTAAQLVQESPARIRHLITKKVIEVYPEKGNIFSNSKIVKSSLLAYYQKQLLREIKEHFPATNYQTLAYQHLQHRIHNLSNFRNDTAYLKPRLKKKKPRNQALATFLFLFWTVAIVGALLFFLKQGYFVH